MFGNFLDGGWDRWLEEVLPRLFDELEKLHKDFMQRVEDAEVLSVN